MNVQIMGLNIRILLIKVNKKNNMQKIGHSSYLAEKNPAESPPDADHLLIDQSKKTGSQQPF